MVKIHSFLFVVWHFLTGISWAMYSKRKLPGDDADPTRRLRPNLADLFLFQMMFQDPGLTPFSTMQTCQGAST